MQQLADLIQTVNGIVWGPAMLVLFLGVGLVLQIGLKVMPLRKIPYAFKQLWQGRQLGSADQGEISPFAALMTAMSATVGTGNIAGVATAIFMGGPGALFWMWCAALLGMATKYAEAVCAVQFREVDAAGNHVGGPMYYIKNGLHPRWRWMAVAFAVFGGFAGFGIGNTVQANSVADVMFTSFGVPAWVSGLGLAVLVGLVILGGIKRIGATAAKLVPAMALLYIGGGLAVLAVFAEQLPQAVALVFNHALSPVAATGGFAGAAVAAAMRFGVARGVFSNEAGMGSAAIAHAASTATSPVRQGVIAMLGTFIDTIIVCSITGLTIIASGVWTSGATGAALTTAAFNAAIPGVGGYIVAVSLVIFAFTTMVGWAFYGEKCVCYLFGVKAAMPFRVLWIVLLPVGAVSNLGLVWLVADTLNALMALPNLIALLLLAPVVFQLTREYFATAAMASD